MINMNETKSSTSDITLGTSYEINKNLVENYEKELTVAELEGKKELVKDFIKETNNQYYMMLCREQNDYTIFKIQDKNNLQEIANVLIDECLKNRGITKGIDKVTGAIEIWLSFNKDSYCYYFFPYDSAVVEV